MFISANGGFLINEDHHAKSGRSKLLIMILIISKGILAASQLSCQVPFPSESTADKRAVPMSSEGNSGEEL
jgi:hypothetical protein